MATPIGDNVVVVDYDDDFFKAGYCIPERDPQVVLPTAVRRPGDGAETFRPIASRRVQDWDQLESLYAHAFYRQLGWVEGDEGAVLVSEPLFTSRADRERLAQTLFESFNVSGLYVAEQPVLVLVERVALLLDLNHLERHLAQLVVAQQQRLHARHGEQLRLRH